MKIGVIGLGTVGYGVIEILTNEKTRLEKEMKQEIVVKYGCGLEEVDLPKEISIQKIIMMLLMMRKLMSWLNLLGEQQLRKTLS